VPCAAVTEFPDYYTRLAVMEREAEDQKRQKAQPTGPREGVELGVPGNLCELRARLMPGEMTNLHDFGALGQHTRTGADDVKLARGDSPARGSFRWPTYWSLDRRSA
jgi:hypothetical protein